MYDTIEGYITVGGERFYVESAKKYKKDAFSDDFVVYKHEDKIHIEGFSCGVHHAVTEQTSQSETNEAFASSYFPNSKVLELATDADYQYVLRNGGTASSANNRILSIINMVDGIYQNQLDIEILVVYQHAWEYQDPYSFSTANYGRPLFDTFQAEWENNPNFKAVHRDTAHLFTGKQGFDYSGLAGEEVVCNNPTFSYGFTGESGDGHFKATAHELGHNVGAHHTDEPPFTPYPELCNGRIMVSYFFRINTNMFCQYSIDQITAHTTNFGSCLTRPPSIEPKQSFDFDGDGRADLAVFRPENGTFYILGSVTQATEQFSPTFINGTPSPADYDRDGKTDAATYNNGRFESKLSSYGGSLFSHNLVGDVAVSADYDGDGAAEYATFSNGIWRTYNLPSQSSITQYYGQAGDIPAQADYDADGKTDLAFFRPSSGTFFIRRSRLGDTNAIFGQSGDIIVSADYDGDNSAEVAVYRGGTWVTYNIRTGQVNYIYNGGFSDKPVVGDYDGDGRADATVFGENSGSGFFSILYSQYGYIGGATLGATTDRPIGFRNPQ